MGKGEEESDKEVGRGADGEKRKGREGKWKGGEERKDGKRCKRKV